jgi:hypothetical protein
LLLEVVFKRSKGLRDQGGHVSRPQIMRDDYHDPKFDGEFGHRNECSLNQIIYFLAAKELEEYNMSRA